MAKTIDDYKKDYAAAQAAGDKAGMAEANNAANALRQQQGQAVQVADVTKEVYGNNYVGSTSAKKPSSSSGSSGTTPGNSASGVGGFTDWQQDIIDKMNQNSNAWHGASQADKDRLHAENEYLSGLLGGNVSFDKNSGTWNGVAEFPAFSYENAPEYTSQWDQIIKDLAGQILDRDPFEYDYLEDPNYQQYREAYTREGERAMVDTLGEVAARTGGMASSYATSAANQANNYYMSALADKIPELRQMAYEAYLQNIRSQRDDLSMLLGLESMDYEKYLNSLGQWNTDRNFDYGIWRDQVNDQRYENEWNYGVAQDEWQKSYIAAQLLADSGNFSGYASLFGLSEDQTQAMIEKYAWENNLTRQQAAMDLADWYYEKGDINSAVNAFPFDPTYALSALMGGGSSGGSSRGSASGSGSSSSGSASTSSDIYQAMYDAGIRDEASAYAWLVSQGYNTTQSGKFAGYYSDWLKNKEIDNNPSTEESEGSWANRLFSEVFGSGGGMNEASFNAAMRSIAVQLESGNADFISDSIDDMWDKANLSQKIQLENLLAMYGYEHTD